MKGNYIALHNRIGKPESYWNQSSKTALLFFQEKILLHCRKPHGCCAGYIFNATLDMCVGKIQYILCNSFLNTKSKVRFFFYDCDLLLCFNLFLKYNAWTQYLLYGTDFGKTILLPMGFHLIIFVSIL